MIFEITNQSPPPQRSISQTATRSSVFSKLLKNKIFKIPVQRSDLTRFSQIPLPCYGFERWEVFSCRKHRNRWLFSLIDPNGGLHTFRIISRSKFSLLALKLRSRAKPSLILCRHPDQSIPLPSPKTMTADHLDNINNVLFNSSMAESHSFKQTPCCDNQNYLATLKKVFSDFINDAPLQVEKLDDFMKSINPGDGIFSRIYHTRRGKEGTLRLANGMTLLVNLEKSECFSQSKNQIGLYRFLHQYCPAAEVESRLKDLFDEINAFRASHYAELFRFLANVYQTLIRIHPYLDGNGRLARSIVCFIFFQHGVFPKEGFSLPREALYRTENDLANLISCRFYGCQHAFSKHH